MSEPACAIRAEVTRGSFRLAVDLAWDERVAVIFGPSGAGKSTLFEVVLGLAPNARAHVRLGGVTLEDAERGLRLPTEQRGLGWVPQDPTLFPHLSVAGNLRFGLRRAGDAGERALARAVDVLELGELLERRTDALSGGERQRVAIARALASAPRALLLDEPLASVDATLRARVLRHLLRLRDEFEIPILYITHQSDEALLVGERAVVLDGGREVAAGAPAEVLWSHAVLPLSRALGLENVFEGTALDDAEGPGLETARGLRLALPFALPAGEQLCVGLRAEDVVLAADPPGRISTRNVLPARVSSCDEQAGSVYVHLALDAGGEPLVACVTRGAAERLALRPSAAVHALIKAQALRRLA